MSFQKNYKLSTYHKFQILTEHRKLTDDRKFWIEKKTFSPDEIAVRFKYKIVSIHCLANGNGRHSRLIADVIISHIFKLPVFNRGSDRLYNIKSTALTSLSILFVQPGLQMISKRDDQYIFILGIQFLIS